MLVGYDDAFAGSTRVKSRVVTINNRVFAAGSWSYEYDGFGRVTSKTNGRETYTYEYLKGTAMPTECVYKRSGMTDRKSTYAYDNRGRITEESEQSYAWDYAKEYTYDGLNRLTGEKISKHGTLSLNRTYTYDGDGRMTMFGNDVVTYDSRGRISKFGSKSYTYDNYGNRTSDGIKTYTWVRGRLLSSVGGASFTYNADGRRYTKAYGGVTATYYYDEDMLLGENRSDGKKLRYFYDSEGMCGFRYYNGSAWTEYVYVKNAKGDVLAILNGSGTVVANYSYDAWGNCTIESQTGGMGDINPIRYRGYYYDGETGLYYLLTRYYDPAIGHFISPDGFEYLDPETIGAINLYAYCRYNPVMYSDPEGKSILQFFISLVSYVGMAIMSIWDDDIKNDMDAIGWNPFNTNESTVVQSSKVSFYKGVPVIRTNMNRSGTFYVIFLQSNANIVTLKHEWGHTIQSAILGPIKYGVMIGLPSAFEWSNRSYYSRPWEITADIFGGVSERLYSNYYNQNDIIRGFAYLGVSAYFGIVSYFFLIGELG